MNFKVVQRLRLLQQAKDTVASKVTCVEFVEHGPEDYEYVFAGAENGEVHMWSQSSLLRNRPMQREKASEAICGNPQHFHRGRVTCLLFTYNAQCCAGNAAILFSGGADRRIRVWEVLTHGPEKCVQVLEAHEGTVTAIVDGADGTIISASTDGCVKVWMVQAGRQLMLHPFFECASVVTLGRVWVTALAMNTKHKWVCYAADSAGTVRLYHRAGGDKSHRIDYLAGVARGKLTLKQQWDHVHALGIHALFVVAERSFLISLSYDGTCKVLDASQGSLYLSVTNPRRGAMYTSVCLNEQHDHLYLCDSIGFVEVWSAFTDRQLAVRNVALESELIDEEAQRASQRASVTLGGESNALLSRMCLWPSVEGVIALSPRLGLCIAWQIQRSGCCRLLVGHDEAVIALSLPPSISAFSNAFQVSRHERLAFSAGHDNTVRCWDEYESAQVYFMSTSTTASASLSDISCMTALWALHMVATGHENGNVVLWNPDSGTRTLSREHSNTVSSLATGKGLRSDVLLSGSYDGTICIWDLALFHENPSELPLSSKLPVGHANGTEILCTAYHSLSLTVFSGGNDGMARGWNTMSGAKCSNLVYHGEPVCSMACSDSILVAGDEQGALAFFRLHVDDDNRRSSEIARAPVLHVELLGAVTLGVYGPTRSIAIAPDPVATDVQWISSAHARGRLTLWKCDPIAGMPSTEQEIQEEGEDCTCVAMAFRDADSLLFLRGDEKLCDSGEQRETGSAQHYMCLLLGTASGRIRSYTIRLPNT